MAILERTPLLTVKGAADLLSVSPNTVYYWVARNEIPYLKVGRHLRFKEPEVMRFFEEKTREEKASCHVAQALVNNNNSSRSLTISSGGLAGSKGVSNGDL